VESLNPSQKDSKSEAVPEIAETPEGHTANARVKYMDGLWTARLGLQRKGLIRTVACVPLE
jgi:hypothetical protein